MPRRVSAATLALENQPHALYRFFDRTDVLLYVGITYDLPTRIKNHRKGKPWWLQVANITIEPYDTRQEALDAEKKAIREEGPLHNDQHNAMVQVPDAPSRYADALSLADVVLRHLNDDDRDVVMSDELHDWDGEQRSKEAQTVFAAESAAVTVMWQRDRSHELLEDLLGLLPQDAGFQHTADANAEHARLRGEDAHYSYVDLVIDAAVLHVENAAAAYLDRLPELEAREWRLCAARIAGLTGGRGDRWAARYAVRWKKQEHTPHLACQGPGRHGARCPTKVDALVFYTECGGCLAFRADCEGHPRWCRTHSQAAVDGDLGALGLRSLVLTVERCEDFDPADLEPPF